MIDWNLDLKLIFWKSRSSLKKKRNGKWQEIMNRGIPTYHCMLSHIFHILFTYRLLCVRLKKKVLYRAYFIHKKSSWMDAYMKIFIENMMMVISIFFFIIILQFCKKKTLREIEDWYSWVCYFNNMITQKVIKGYSITRIIIVAKSF